jgi:tetratricopeptide (TPR) repeat protein
VNEGALRLELERWRAEGAALSAAARYAEAASKYAQCEQWAAELADAGLQDEMFCNRAQAAIMIDHGAEFVPRLREILMSNRRADASWHAAYLIAYHYELEKSPKKAAFYARIAVERAATIQHSEWLAGSRNQLGNALLVGAAAADAEREYSAALAVCRQSSSVAGVVLNNLGYCKLLQGQLREGLRLLYRSLRLLRTTNPQYRIQVHLDLSFGLLEVSKWRAALRHATRALREARSLAVDDQIKNALYLMGEAARQGGELATAEECFAALQEEFYPTQPYLSNLLMSVDVRSLVNLHA